MQELYLTVITQLEKLHRLSLDLIATELAQMKKTDINNVQCVILYNIGTEKLSIGEISSRGYYLGSNVTYNLKKLVENGYVKQVKSTHNKRSSHVMLSLKGTKLYKNLCKFFKSHISNMTKNNLDEKQLKDLSALFTRLEKVWSFINK